MVLDLSVFRYERQLLRSQRRLESLRVEEAYDRSVKTQSPFEIREIHHLLACFSM